MLSPKLVYKNPIFSTYSHSQNSPKNQSFHLLRPILSTQKKPPNIINKNLSRSNTHLFKSITTSPDEDNKAYKNGFFEKGEHFSQVGSGQMSILCGLGYWVQGFRGFPWLALNFHMAHNLQLNPSTLQLVQNAGNLPMVLKPLYGILSDTVYIGGAHRVPYICIGVLLQILAWGSLALTPIASEILPNLVICVLLSNLGASITEVAKDALVAEYGQNHKMMGLQSYAFMALATGGLLGNLLGGFFLLKTQNSRYMFLIFTCLLSLQLAFSLSTREDYIGLPKKKLVSERDGFSKQFTNLKTAIGEEAISRPLIWVVASISMVPTLSGSIFCYQTQCLNLNPLIIGMSKVAGQMMLLFITLLYDRFWRTISIRKLIGLVQFSYAFSLLLDLILVKQLNLRLGISNDVFALCFSGLAEIIAQFKLLPFLVLFANLAPLGCEGSVTSFLASALCLSSIVSGFFGVVFASLLGIQSGDYSNLPVGIVIQFVAALVPLKWIYTLPASQNKVEKEKKRVGSKRVRRYRRVGRVILDYFYAYCKEREQR